MAYRKIVLALSIDTNAFNQLKPGAEAAMTTETLLEQFYQRISPVVDKAFAILPPVGSKKCANCELHLVHVTELETLPILEDSIAMGLPGIWSEDAQEQVRWLTELFDSVSQRICLSKGIKPKACQKGGVLKTEEEIALSDSPKLCSRVLVGDATKELSQYLTTVKADLLMIRFDREPSQQANWLKKFQYCLVGTTESLVSEVNCDVLIIK